MYTQEPVNFLRASAHGLLVHYNLNYRYMYAATFSYSHNIMKPINCLRVFMGLWYTIKYNDMQNFLREAGVGMAFIAANITAAVMKSKFKLLNDILINFDEMALSKT